MSERVRKPWKQLIGASTKPQVSAEKKNPWSARVNGNRCKVGLLRLTSSLAICSESETRKVDLW